MKVKWKKKIKINIGDFFNTSLFLDWLYPRRCVFCDGLLRRKEKFLCSSCSKIRPQLVLEPKCKKCGKQILNIEKEYCYDCSHFVHDFDSGRGLFLYQEPLKSAVMRFKFNGRKEYGQYLGRLMQKYSTAYINHIKPDVIIPVPIHKRKYYTRGYNQAEVLAREMSRGFSIPIRTDLVLRKKFTKAQKELGKKERKKNLEKAFEVNKEVSCYSCILLVDDIYTTGSTIHAIAKKLKEKGVKKVYFISLCIGKGL